MLQKFNNTNHDCELMLENGTILTECMEDQEAQAIPRMLYNVRCPPALPGPVPARLFVTHCMGQLHAPAAQSLLSRWCQESRIHN